MNRVKNIFKAYFLFLLIIAGIFNNSCSRKSSTQLPEELIVLRSQKNHGGNYNWKMKRVSEVPASGSEISKPDFETSGWEEAIVPGTVLNSLVANGVFPEPYYGQNNMRINKLIPDIADVGRDYYHYWFRTTFQTPENRKEKKWLEFEGVNYIAHIWLNGNELGSMEGMFSGKKFDVSKYLIRGKENCLAVSVEPVKYPGTMQPRSKENTVFNENRNGGDGKIGKNVTMLMSAGWDFTYHDGIRDRNTGIWRDINLYSTGTVTLENPFVKSSLPIPDLSPSHEIISFEINNHSDIETEVNLSVSIPGASVSINKPIILKEKEKRKIVLNPDEYPELIFDKPKLWWPINKGDQNLYSLSIKAMVDGKNSDEINTRFGIRDIRSDRNTPDSSRIFYINGKRLFIRGANWIPEAMLRTSEERTYAELRYTKQAGINMLRLWGGGISESDYFFDLCDELGFLLWHEFWMTGDTDPPEDTTVYFNNIRSTIKRIRNHPSLAYYVSSNEQDDILDIKSILMQLDGTRGYQFQSECCGVHDGSPYKYENPMQYYDNTASDRGSRIDGFCPEYGTPCLPIIEALRGMIPEEDLWPMNKRTWDYLDGNGFHYMTTKYNTAIGEYGEPASIEDYALKGQLVGAVSYRSIWENWNYNKYSFGDRFASGVLFWYHNSPVKQLCSRMWDWSLEPTAALYFAQNAMEPLHAQFDFIKNTVSVYNDYYAPFNGLRINFRLINMNMETLIEKEAVISIGEDAVANDILKINIPEKELSPVHFIKLEIIDSDGEHIAETFYWRSTDKYKGPWTVGGPIHGGFESLSQLEPVFLDYTVEKNRNIFIVKVENNSVRLAFFNRLKAVSKKDGMLLRPVFYSDNYFSLLPGETKTVEIDIGCLNAKLSETQLVLQGFNVKETILN